MFKLPGPFNCEPEMGTEGGRGGCCPVCLTGALLIKGWPLLTGGGKPAVFKEEGGKNVCGWPEGLNPLTLDGEGAWPPLHTPGCEPWLPGWKFPPGGLLGNGAGVFSWPENRKIIKLLNQTYLQFTIKQCWGPNKDNNIVDIFY